MSASREKKTRQELLSSGGQTEKERLELKAAQKAKNKKILYWVIGIVVAVLVVALLIWDSGIFQRRAAAATVGSRTYSVSDASFYYGSVKSQITQYASYGLFTYDSAKSPAEQTVDSSSASSMAIFGIDATEGQTYEEVFRQYALNSLQYEALMCDQAAAEGYTLSEEGKQSVDSTYQQYKDAAAQQNTSVTALLKANYSDYLTESVFKTRLTNATLASEFEQHKKDSYQYSDAEVDAYYKENKGLLDTIQYRTAYISGTPASATDSNGQTVEPSDSDKAVAMQQAKAKADAMVKQVQGGTAFHEAAQQYVAETSQAQYEDPDYGVYSTVGSNLSPTYQEWLIDGSRKVNDVTAIEIESGYYVVQYLGSELDTETRYSADIRHILVKAETDEPATAEDGTTAATPEPTEEQYAAAKAKIEEIKAEFEAGDKTPEAFGALADKYSEDPGSNGSNVDNGGSSGGYYQVLQTSSFFADFQNWSLDPTRKAGDLGVIQNTQTDQWGYHLLYFQEAGPLVWKHNALTTMQSDAYQSWYDETVANYAAAMSSGMDMLG